MKTPFSIIYNYFENIGCKLEHPTEETYNKFKIKSEKMRYICPNGHNDTSLWWNIKRKGCCCLECFKLRKRISYQDIIKSFVDRGYEVISPLEKNYTAAYKQKIGYICPNGHSHSIRYADFLNNHGCPECVGLLKHTFEDIKKSFISSGYILLSDRYINNKHKLQYRCPSGHTHSIRYDDWQKEVRCGICDQSKISNQEVDVANFIESLGVKIIRNNRNIIKPLELDVFIPHLNLAFEYNGNFWHIEGVNKPIGYHQMKTNMCAEKGIKLIHVWEHDWVDDEKFIKECIRREIDK
jgi:hypothetical protein